MFGSDSRVPRKPEIVPLGECALLVRFGRSLEDGANKAALTFATRLASDPVVGVREVVPSLVSVLVRYDPGQVGAIRLAGELGLRLPLADVAAPGRLHRVQVYFDGPDLTEIASLLGLSTDEFVEAHNAAPLRVLATGFAPGFVYCGFHPQNLAVPRRTAVRAEVPAGSVLFAAGQTAIAATVIPTGWHVIGHTELRNFNPELEPPTLLAVGDHIAFEAVH